MDEARLRAKATAEFVSLLSDEAAHVSKYKRTATRIKVLGIACILIALALAGMPWDWRVAAVAFLGIAGGLLGGMSVAFDNSLRSWPIVKPLLRDDALEVLVESGIHLPRSPQ